MEKVSVELSNKAESEVRREDLFSKIAFGILLFASLLVPVLFVPINSVPFQGSKMIVLVTATLVALVFWIVARLKDGRFVFPGWPLLLSAAVVVVVTALSGLFSGAIGTTFIGQSLDPGTVGSIAILFILLFLISVTFHSKDRIFYAYLLFFTLFFILALFHLSRFVFGAGFLSWGIFTDITSNVVGKWNDLAVFFGIGSVISFVTLELISLSRLFKTLAYVALAVALFFLAVIGFSQVWYVLALFSLMFLVYVISFDKRGNAGISDDSAADKRRALFRRVPATSLAVLIVSLFFILGGGMVGTAISNKFGINQAEVRPSWAATFEVAKGTLAHHPFLGAGPNRFTSQWLLYKPDGVNSTVFWNTDFSYGVGFIPTFLVTTGLLGVLSWAAFLLLFLWTGFRAILYADGDKVSRYLIVSSFLVSLFLWIVNIFYVPSISIVILTFFFTGLYLASLFQANAVASKTIVFADNPRKGFVSVLVLILALIGAVVTGWAFVEVFAASVDFQSGVLVWNNEGNFDKAESYITKAVAVNDDAMYERALSQLGLIKLSSLLSQNASSSSQDVLRSNFQTLFSSALGHAQTAVALDGSDYQNWLALGQVYESVVPLKIQNAYESAASAYDKALTENPKGPAIFYTLARLEATQGNNSKAKQYVDEALQQKNNYTNAIYLLAQIQVNEGNLKDAITSVEAAATLAPNDSGTFFELGLLRYNNKDYAGAASALERAVAINPSYANAKYFLGLSYQKLGRVNDALAQFQDLKTTNPDNKEIDLIISNLTAGRDPFANATPPITNTPEKRKSPPVPEAGSKGASSSGVDTVNPGNTSL